MNLNLCLSYIDSFTVAVMTWLTNRYGVSVSQMTADMFGNHNTGPFLIHDLSPRM